jgi:hypothetical protein
MLDRHIKITGTFTCTLYKYLRNEKCKLCSTLLSDTNVVKVQT